MPNNLVYLAQSVSKGAQALDKISSLLQPLGLNLKGEDGVTNLRAGGTAQLLGFSLRRVENQLQLWFG